MKKFSLVALFLGVLPLFAEENKVEEIASQPVDIAKVSEAFGHVMRKNLDSIGLQFDIAQVVKGLQDAADGKDSPMSEMECVQAIQAVQQKLFLERSTENMKSAEAFLASNKKAKGVVSLEDGKVQYVIDKAGEGEAVEAHNSPLIRYTGKFLDGSVFGASTEDDVLSMDEIIPGLKQGLLGMKEGEKRTIHIHPDMGYGVTGYLPPNSLLTFEVEIVKANAPIPANDTPAPANQEIAEVKTDIR